MWEWQILTYVAVNAYALLSGYVGRTSNFRLSKMALIWLQVFFYSFGMTVVFALLGFPLQLADWGKAFFPIVTRQYWYMSAYLGLLLFQPLLNKGIAAMRHKELKQILLVGFVLFSLIPALLHVKVLEFSLSKGFGLTWLVMMYITGAFLAATDIEQVSMKSLWLIYFGSSLVTGLGNHFVGEIWFWYTSPSMIVASISFFLLFAKRDLRAQDGLVKWIQLLAPASLGVYLVHLNRLVERFFLHDKLVFLLDLEWYWLFIAIPALAVVIYLVATVIELGRIKIFDIAKIEKYVQIIDKENS